MSHVTGHVTKRDTKRDMSRVTVHVSNTTTTTPHYTLSLVASAGGLDGGSDFHPSLQSVEAHPRAVGSQQATTRAAQMDDEMFGGGL